jgi:hypothetical protein
LKGKQEMTTYTTNAGRLIEIDGQPFVTIHKCEGVDPCVADTFARDVSTLFNKREWEVDRVNRETENIKHALEQAHAQMSSICEMVAALECDYDRLGDLREERKVLVDNMEEATTYPDRDENSQAGAINALNDWDELNKEELDELEQAAGDCENYDQAYERIQEDPLSVEVRSGWHAPGGESEPEEFCILLCTGGPAVRIVGELGQHNTPDAKAIEYQDWFTPWTALTDNVDYDALTTYCQQFYFGD